MSANKEHLKKITKIEEDENNNILKIDEQVTGLDGTIFKSSIVPSIKPAGDKTHLLERDNSFDPAIEQYDNTQESSKIFGNWFDLDNYEGLLNTIRPSTYFSNNEITTSDNSNDNLIDTKGINDNLYDSNDVPIFDYNSILNPDYKTPNAEYVLSNKGMELIANDPGYKNRNEIKAKNDKFLADKKGKVTSEDLENVNSIPSAQAAVKELENDIKLADGNKKAIESAGQDFMEGLQELTEYNPQLTKSLFAMAGAMMMGDSFSDAMTTGFGVIEEAAMKKEAADTANDQKIIEMLMDNPQYMNPDDFLTALQELGISEKDLPYYKSIFASKVAETNVKAAKEYVTLQANATKTIKNDLIKDENSNHIDELNRLFSHIQNNDRDFDFSDPGQSWAVYEAFSNWEQAKRIAKEEGNDEIIMEPTVFYENLFGLLDANGDATITVPQSQDNQVLQAIVKNALRTVYRTKEGADEAEKRISREWHSNSINKSKSSEEYLKYLAMEANDLEREYLADLRK